VLAALGLAVALAGDGPGLRSVAMAAVGVGVAGVAVRLIDRHRLLGAYSVLVYLLLFIPIVVVVVYAFNSNRIVALWDGFSTKWFSVALERQDYRDAIWRSVRMAAASSVISVVLGVAAALALGRARRAARVPVELVIFLTLVVPDLVIGVASLVFFDRMGFQLGLMTMFLANSIYGISLVALIVRTRFATMGDSLEEASRDLGAGAAATFRQITLPRLAPAIAAGFLLAFTFSFDDVVVSNFTSGAGNDTWPLLVFSALRRNLSPDLNAMATLMLAITLLLLALAGLILWVSGRRTRRGSGESVAAMLR
jgi:ABC-type spermidine/putrescine transport system permease subunit II